MVTHDESFGEQNTGVADLPREDNDDDDTADPAVAALFAFVAGVSGVENPGADLGTGGLPGFARSAAALVDTSTSVFGADEENGTTALSLRLAGGVASLVSGLLTTDGLSIVLVVENGLVVGRVDADGDTVVSTADAAAFAIAIDGSGFVSLAQYLSLDHPTFPDNFDESLALGLGLVEAVVTVTDGDLDVDPDF